MPKFNEVWLSVPLHRVAGTQDQSRWSWIIDIVKETMPEPARWTDKQNGKGDERERIAKVTHGMG